MADIALREQGLALQIAGLDHIVVDQGQPPDPGSGEVLQRRRADPAKPDQRDMRISQRYLPRATDFGQDDVAGKAVETGGR